MGFFLTKQKNTIQQQIYIQLGPGKALACWSLPSPPSPFLVRLAGIVGSHQWKVYGFLFFAHCLLNDPLWCPCGPNGLGQVGNLVDESGSSGMKSYPRDEVIAGKIVFVSCACFFFGVRLKDIERTTGTSCMYIIDKVSAFFPRKVICQCHSFIDVRLWFWMQIKKKPWKIKFRHVLHFFTSTALRQAWFLYSSRRRSMEELLPDAPLVEYAREQLGWMQDAAES